MSLVCMPKLLLIPLFILKTFLLTSSLWINEGCVDPINSLSLAIMASKGIRVNSVSYGPFPNSEVQKARLSLFPNFLKIHILGELAHLRSPQV